MPWKIAHADFEQTRCFHIADAANRPIHLIVDVARAACRLYLGGTGPEDAPMVIRVDADGAALIRVTRFRDFYVDVARNVLASLGCPVEEVDTVLAPLSDLCHRKQPDQEGWWSGDGLEIAEDALPDPLAWVRDLDDDELIAESRRLSSGVRHNILAAEIERRGLSRKTTPRQAPRSRGSELMREAVLSYTRRWAQGAVRVNREGLIANVATNGTTFDKAFDNAWREFLATAPQEGITPDRDVDPDTARLSERAVRWWRPIFVDACKALDRRPAVTTRRHPSEVEVRVARTSQAAARNTGNEARARS